VVEGRVVYANYGTRQDFAKLKELGIDCTGAIVLARYGGNYRGFKVKFAQEAGAAGIVIFTDPGDSGFVKGPVYPQGGYANECCIQRGSIVTMPFQGDPLTPGREATEHVERMKMEEAVLPRIPCQPIGYAAAKEILASMKGAEAPQAWQGGLGFPYRLTSDDGAQVGTRLKLSVQQERAIMKTANVIAEIPGTEHPEQRVIIGAHHDAWNHGAADPLCGTIAVVEAARIYGELARQGVKPRRTLVFAAWGAEEFGIIGSSEWVEANERMLIEGGVAYINLDMASMGPQFGASATPSMHRAIVEAAKLVPQAGDATRTVFADWAARSSGAAGGAEAMLRVPVPGSIGGGSDHVAFIARAGVASASFGSGGSSGWSYHSAYDTLPWYWKVVGSDYESAAMMTRMSAVVAGGYAFEAEPVVSPQVYGRVGLEGIARAEKAGREAGLDVSGLERLKVAMVELTLNGLEARASGRGGLAPSMGVDRAWLEAAGGGEGGLERRPWFRNVFAAPDESTGYDAWVLPMLQAAVERKDQAEFDLACQRTLARIEAAIAALQ
jgi:N-acetylated-alpha-linked acidic dipeptidase